MTTHDEVYARARAGRLPDERTAATGLQRTLASVLQSTPGYVALHTQDDGSGPEDVWIPPSTDCLQFSDRNKCSHCAYTGRHARTGRCGACGRRPLEEPQSARPRPVPSPPKQRPPTPAMTADEALARIYRAAESNPVIRTAVAVVSAELRRLREADRV